VVVPEKQGLKLFTPYDKVAVGNGISGGSRKTRIETIQFSRPDLSG